MYLLRALGIVRFASVLLVTIRSYTNASCATFNGVTYDAARDTNSCFVFHVQHERRSRSSAIAKYASSAQSTLTRRSTAAIETSCFGSQTWNSSAASR